VKNIFDHETTGGERPQKNDTDRNTAEKKGRREKKRGGKEEGGRDATGLTTGKNLERGTEGKNVAAVGVQKKKEFVSGKKKPATPPEGTAPR